jgi:pimeloyl-ACP methyl ester carboxylesterase
MTQNEAELGGAGEPHHREHELLLRHPDGRGVLCAVFGARDHKRVVFYSHGFPASRIEAAVAHREAMAQGITIIALDRPGFGSSDWYGERRFEDWAKDVTLVADHLSIERFAILGVSGGTPTAVAAAALLKGRVSSLCLVSGLGPLTAPEALGGFNLANRALLFLGLRAPRLSSVVMKIIASMWRSVPVTAMVWFGALLPAVDKEIIARRDVRIVLAKNIRESLRQGVRGVVTEFLLFMSEWRPLLRQIEVPTTIWHGDADTYVPLTMAGFLQKEIQGSVFHKVEGGGHFMIIDRLPTILRSIGEVDPSQS